MKYKKSRIVKSISIFLAFAIMLSSCQLSPNNNNKNTNTESTQQSYPVAEIFFAVTIPDALAVGENVYLCIEDEVTGISNNIERILMNKGDELHYYVAIPFPLGSIIKYRYLRKGDSDNAEYDSRDQPVRYRMYYVGGPGEVMDSVSGWADSIKFVQTGRITGKVSDVNTNAGIPDILITAGGRYTFSDSNGEFVLEDIPAGNNNLVAYSIDGRYQPFQQGSIVATGKRTPVSISLTPSRFVNVIFTVSLPANTVPSAPVRIAGNLHQLGNTFGDLQGGVSNQYSQLPVLSLLPDGRFSYSIMLPVGTDIRYKYTLGDGFWNAEHSQDGEFKIRQLIVPESDIVVQDNVESWQSDSNAPIIFDVTAPENTPSGDRISIQFNTDEWTEPIEMWSLGNNRWVYQLFGPYDNLNSLKYTYCRNDQCNLVLDPSGNENPWYGTISRSETPQNRKDEIPAWKWTSNYQLTDNFESPAIARTSSFWKGIEFLPFNYPSWMTYAPEGLQVIKDIGSNTLVISPSWSLLATNPMEFSLRPGGDLFGTDLNSLLDLTHEKDLKIALFPTINTLSPLSEWWSGAELNSAWWDNWFSLYRSYILYYADLSSQNTVDTLILGGDWLLPSLPGGTLPDGNNSNPPADSASRWSSLIVDIRQHFSGKLYWSVNYPGGLVNAPDLINELDGIYLLWSAPLADNPDASVNDMKFQAEILLDNEIAPFKSTFQKPIIIALAYPSITGSGLGCDKNSLGYCKDWMTLNQPDPIIENAEVNLLAQQDAYEAMFLALNERTWVDGIISRGFYFPLSLQDASASIFGKPTITLVNQWFHSLESK